MSSDQFQDLLTKLPIIAEVVNKFQSEQLQLKSFAILVKTINSSLPDSEIDGKNNSPEEPLKPIKKKTNGNAKKAERRNRGTKESYSIDRDLNLRGDKKAESFRSFVESKKPKSAKEFNTVAVYYLKKILNIEKVTLDHVYTCYSEASRKPPQAFRQSFTDTKNKEGWIEFDGEGYLNIPHRGDVYVTHDLPKKEAE